MPTPPLPISRTAVLRPLYASGQRNRVFICADDLDFAAEMASALTPAGFDVRTLSDGKSPVEIFELFRPDVVFLDIFMPPPDGFELMDHISRDTRQSPLSLALVSGADSKFLDVAAHFCQARGLKTVAVLQKPVRLKAVLDICRDHARKYGNPIPGDTTPSSDTLS